MTLMESRTPTKKEQQEIGLHWFVQYRTWGFCNEPSIPIAFFIDSSFKVNEFQIQTSLINESNIHSVNYFLMMLSVGWRYYFRGDSLRMFSIMENDISVSERTIHVFQEVTYGRMMLDLDRTYLG